MRWFQRAFVSSYFVYKRLYEDPFGGLIRQRPELVAPGDILDVGANIGYTSCLFARGLKPGSKVYAFEPDQFSYGILQDVIRRQRLSQVVEALNIAVGASDGYVAFWHNDQHSADHRVVTDQFRRSQLDDAKISSVPAISIDSFVRTRQLRKLSLIKIDVQGYEPAVAEGMRQTLAEFPGLCVCVEYSPEALTDLGFDPVALLDFFRSNQYQLHILTRTEIKLARDNAAINESLGKAGYVNLLCSRRVFA